ETLRASEERFRTLVSSLDEVVFSLDRGRGVDGVFGRSGRAAAELVAELVAADAAAIARALAGEHASYEVPIGDPPRHFLVSLSAVHDAARRGTGVVRLGRDLPEPQPAPEQLPLPPPTAPA